MTHRRTTNFYFPWKLLLCSLVGEPTAINRFYFWVSLVVVSCLSHHDEKLGLHTTRKWTMPESWRTSMFFFLLPHKIQYFKVVFHWHDPYLLSCHTSHFTLMFWGPFSKQYVHSVSLALVPAQVEIKHLWHIPAPGQPQPSQLSSHLHHNQIFFLFLWTCHPLSWNSLSLDILFCKPWLTLSSTNESALCTEKVSSCQN